jgi:hypothetical protein
MPKTNGTAPTNIDIEPLRLAWAKITRGRIQESEGRKLWTEGTLELINILHNAREHFSSDQAFGKWLTDSGYGENRISRQDRSALLNMAEHPELTREILEQIHGRSWQLIWRDEIQPRLPNARQPADDEEAPAITRRPKKSEGAKKALTDEWSKDRKAFFRRGLVLLSQSVAAFAEKNHIFEKTHLFSMRRG